MEINKINIALSNKKAVFRLTRRCNNNCSHCYLNLPLNANTKELTAEEWTSIIDQLWLNGYTNLAFTGGEITVSPNFKKVYMYAKRKGMSLDLLTNATNFDKETKKMLYNFPPHLISTTIYGASKKVYNLVTGNEKGWQAFSKNIIFMSNLEKDKGTILKFYSLFTKDNFKSRKEINEFSLKYTGKTLLSSSPLYLGQDKDPLRDERIKLKRLSKEELKEVYIDFKNEEEACKNTTFNGLEPINDNLFACNLGTNNSIYFFEDGTVSYCNLITDERYTVKLGSEELKNFDFKMVENNLHKKIEPLLNLKINKKCAICSKRKYCLSCPAKNLLEKIALDGWNKEFCLLELEKEVK